jgi:predicted RNase H-like HicB family nuclease
MITEYIEAAMQRAHYELLENGRFFGSIAPCKGLWAEGKTLESCREELRSTLEEWLLLGLRLGHKLPTIDGLNLNRSYRRKAAHAQTH